MVLLSGMLGDASVWRDVADRLGDVAECRFPRIDGHDSVAALAASVLRESPGRFAVGGHSLGGIVALAVMRLAPGRVTGLALLNTSARPGSPEQLATWEQMARRTSEGEFGAVAGELATLTLPEGQRHPPLLERNAAMPSTVGATGFLRQLSAQRSRPDSRPFLGDIAVPTVVVTGALDEVSPAHLQQELVSGIPHARHVVLDCGHMSPLEAPEQVALVLGAWLDPTETSPKTPPEAETLPRRRATR